MTSTLLVDIGNTRVKWLTLGDSTTFDTISSSMHDALPTPLVARPPDRIVFTNVASGAVAERVFASWPDVVAHEVLARPEAYGIRNGYREPARLGADRWAALIGAHALAPERDLLVCGFGTATTVDLLIRAKDADEPARFVGGMIFPGTSMMRRALARDTARLPLAAGRPTDFAIDTDDAIASGIVAAQVGAVERAASRARALHEARDLLIVLTGGDADSIADDFHASDECRVVPDLVLRGLAVVARDDALQ